MKRHSGRNKFNYLELWCCIEADTNIN